MTNREAIFQVVKAFGCASTSCVWHWLNVNHIYMTLDDVKYELGMLLAQDKIYQHNHPNWKEPCWLDPQMSENMKWWGEQKTIEG